MLQTLLIIWPFAPSDSEKFDNTGLVFDLLFRIRNLVSDTLTAYRGVFAFACQYLDKIITIYLMPTQTLLELGLGSSAYSSIGPDRISNMANIAGYGKALPIIRCLSELVSSRSRLTPLASMIGS
ncbi:hypothetical protein AcW1_002222 [Taiwanofungus camphoratus]|nr:hypothetical protein AcV5_010216 [Antrodia cinnamomea]KAI0944540.1 hypothetical protein AcW1_002222 [Antrodia cinnamomea]KAI0946199.1 hypothetical protein AcV7_010236 [Antrodia cinnamomea]